MQMAKAKAVSKIGRVSKKKNRRVKRIDLMAVAEELKRRSISSVDIHEWYKPIKHAVTIRIDAEVLAWFKRPGRGYQTRINRALWKVMKEEQGASETAQILR